MKKIIIMIIMVGVILLLNKSQILQNIYPKKYSDYVEKYSKENNIDPLLIYSIIKAESNFNVKAKSNSNAIGIMQIMLKTAQETANNLNMSEITEEDLYDAETNIKIGIRYFKNLVTKYDNYILAIIAYNAGMGNLDSWLEQGIIDREGKNIEQIPFLETRNYANKILHNYKIYKEIY